MAHTSIAAQGAAPQPGNSIHWEFRSYFAGSRLEHTELVLVIKSQNTERKVFVAIAAAPRPGKSVYPVDLLGKPIEPKPLGPGDYSLDFETDAVVVARLVPFGDLPPEIAGPPLRMDPQRIALPDAASYRLDNPVFVDAATLFTRPLLLKNPPMNGDDVWVLQRHLQLKGFRMTDGPSGVFDAETNSLARSSRWPIETGDSPNEGGVTKYLWTYIVEAPAEPAEK